MTERKLKWIVYAVVFHLALLGLLIIGFQWSDETAASRPATPEPIQATVVDAAVLEEQAAKLRATEEKQRQAELDRQRRIKEEQARLEKLKREREAAEKAAAAEKARLEKQEQERKARAAEEAQRKAEAERQAKAEAERKAREAEEKKEQAEREAQIQSGIAAEERARARAEAVALGEYKTSIAQKVVRNWIAPANVPADLSCKVEVMQLPGGIVAGEPKIVAGECNTADPLVLQSIITAVKKSDPLPPPPAGWEQLFDRRIIFTFNPEGL